VTEWDANAYHRVSGPQTEWGRRVLARLELSADARVIDAGCGTGRLTRELLERIPDGRLMALDRSWNMLLAARAYLEPDFGGRVRFCQIELPRIPFANWADLVFSTATFHWVRDHVALFAEILGALRRGGRLFAQCGGGPNLAAAHALASEVMQLEPFEPYFRTWHGVWEFATPETTAHRLRAAGFIGVVTSLEPAGTTLEDESAYRNFVTTVIYHPHLQRLPDHTLRARFIDEVTARAARQTPPFMLDYWRLNLQGQRP
jgi:trans-aconitate methyltransferase